MKLFQRIRHRVPKVPGPSAKIPFTLASAMFGAFLFLVACGTEPLPAAGRPDFPQPTFVSVEVTPAPISVTATPWPNLDEKGVRILPPGLDPELYARADRPEIVDLWTQFLTGSAMQATSGNFFFRRRPRFEGELHLCPGGAGYLEGEPQGPAKWSVNASAGAWYEVTLTHEIPFSGTTVTFALGIHDGLPVRSGSTNPIEFIDSDRCILSEPGIQPSFTADERKLPEPIKLAVVEIEDIPWIDGRREFPVGLTVEGEKGLDEEQGINYWYAYLSGSVVDVVAYNYSSRAVFQAFSGSLHLCAGRVAVLDGDAIGIGEWAVQSTGPHTYDAKIVFTLPDDPTFRTLVLGVSEDLPVRMGRSAVSGLIEATPLELSESDECGA
jgi:hypothetical protein